MSKSNPPSDQPFGQTPDQPEDEKLLGDLESIKSLLDEEDDDPGEGVTSEDTPTEDDDVPLLEDAIDEPRSGLADSAFKTLLGDAWQESVDDLFGDARDTIEANAEKWYPEDTDELANALKVRIDARVKEWLAETLQANIGELRKHIVADLSAEIMQHVKDKISEARTPNKDSDTNG